MSERAGDVAPEVTVHAVGFSVRCSVCGLVSYAMPKDRAIGRQMAHQLEHDLADQAEALDGSDTTDDFDPRTDPSCTPFGIPAGAIPMGTLGEVMGKERADKVLAQMRKVRPPWSAGDFFRRRWTR